MPPDMEIISRPGRFWVSINFNSEAAWEWMTAQRIEQIVEREFADVIAARARRDGLVVVESERVTPRPAPDKEGDWDGRSDR